MGVVFNVVMLIIAWGFSGLLLVSSVKEPSVLNWCLYGMVQLSTLIDTALIIYRKGKF